jgi:hypothetical protein
MALAVLMTTGSAFAQLGSKTPEVQNDVRGTGKELLGTEKLDPDTQKSAIAEAVRKERKAVVEPPKFVVSIGAPVPPAIELYMLPDVVLSQVPAAKSVKFTVVDNQLVLVDPTTMRVVDVIPR